MNTAFKIIRHASLAILFSGLSSFAFAQASLEVPQANSFQSGTGIFGGWSCAGPVSIDIDGVVYATSYGTPRNDAAATCGGNANVGFSLLTSYNLYGAGNHSAQLVVNGKRIGDPVPFTVTVPGGKGKEFLSGLSKTITVADFPSAGKTTTLVWQEAMQNFAIASVLGVSQASTYPISFKGIELQSIAFTGNYGACQASLSLKNTSTVTHNASLSFNVFIDGVNRGTVAMPVFGLAAGETTTTASYVVLNSTSPACGTFEMQFDPNSSAVY